VSGQTLQFDYADFFGTVEASWHHVVVVRDVITSRMHLYLDGAIQTDVDSGLTYAEGTILALNYPGSDIFVGAKDAAFTNKASITVDEITFWKRALIQPEITWLYNGGSGRETNIGELEIQYPLRER